LGVGIGEEDANSYLVKVGVGRTTGAKTRSLVFLDPYGMQDEWSTINVMAEKPRRI
jgi:hypothetical protein